MKQTILTLICITVFSQFTLFSQKKKITIGEKHTIHSEILNQDRDIFIHLPNDYEHSVSNYPVLYVMDAENTFKPLSGLVDLNAWARTIPQMIVVGIPNIERYKDFKPGPDSLPTKGNADKFVSFFQKELFPYIHKNFRTEPFKILYGFSYTGMFALHCFKNYPETFNAYIAGSPSLQHNIDQLCDKNRPLKKLDHNIFLHISVGEKESENYIDNMNRFSTYLKNAENAKLHLETYLVNKATHATNPSLSFSYGLNFIYPDWVDINQVIYKGMPAIEQYYTHLSNRYGYTVKIPEDIYQVLGDYCLKNNMLAMGIKIFEKYASSYTTSFKAYNCLGEALLANKQTKEAEENFKKAVELKPNYKAAKDNLKKLHHN